MERGERRAGGALLSRLLRRARADPCDLAADDRSARERALVRRTRDLHDLVGDLPPEPRERLLQLRLVVDMRRQRVLDPLLEGVDDRFTQTLEAERDVEGAERRLDERREDVPVRGQALELTGRDAGLRRGLQPRAELQAASDDRAAGAADDVRPDPRQLALARLREALVERLRDRELEDAVAEELEPLIGCGPVVDERRMREDPGREVLRQLVDEREQRCARSRLRVASRGRRCSRRPDRRSGCSERPRRRS